MLLDVGQPKVRYDGNILDIEVPPQMETAVSVGHTHMNVLFAGDGMIPSTAALITGLPGAGKTTLMIQVADSITRTGNVCLYNTGEESLYQVRRVTKRLGLSKHAGGGFIPSYHRNVDDITAHMDRLRKKYPGKQIFLVQDSLQCLEPSRIDPDTGKKMRGRPKQGLAAQVAACAQLTQYVKDTFSILLLIGQVTKNGTFAGKQQIKHIIDCHLHLGLDTDKKSESYGCRVAEMLKNRFGPAGIYFDFDLEARGLVFAEAAKSSIGGKA